MFWKLFFFGLLVTTFVRGEVTVDDLGEHRGNDPGNFCDCGLMDSPTGTDPIMIHHFHVGFNECTELARVACRNLCVALMEAGRNTGYGKAILCGLYQKDLNAKINLFSRICNEKYAHSGIQYVERICCKGGKNIACASQKPK